MDATIIIWGNLWVTLVLFTMLFLASFVLFDVVFFPFCINYWLYHWINKCDILSQTKSRDRQYRVDFGQYLFILKGSLFSFTYDLIKQSQLQKIFWPSLALALRNKKKNHAIHKKSFTCWGHIRLEILNNLTINLQCISDNTERLIY